MTGGAPQVRARVLREAERLVCGPREAAHGAPRKSFSQIAALWSAILDRPVSPEQVALCMAALKIARAAHDPVLLDNWVDLAGYAALGAELADAPAGGGA